MKRIYLCAIAMSIGSLTFGQALQQQVAFGAQDVVELKTNNNNVTNEKALGTVIYSNDFNVPGDWTIDNDGQTGAQFGWTIDATNDGWWSAAGIASTSGGNYAELSNGDPTGPPAPVLNVTYTLTTASALNLVALGGSENVVLEFEQYGARFNDLQEIQISTDGTTFVPIGDNLGFGVLSSSGGSPYPNPDLKLIDLSPYLTAATATSVWIRYSWTTNFPAQATNPNVWITYGWYLDDMKIRTKPDNNLVVTNSEWASLGIHYHRIPIDQVTAIDYSANVENAGTNNLGGSILTVDVNTGTTIVTSTPVTINASATDSLVATYTPAAAIGTHTFTWAVSSDSIDDVPIDNTIIGNTFDVTPGGSAPGAIYARDTYGTPGNGGGYNNTPTPPTEDFEAGSYYDIFANQQLYAIDVVVGANTQVGAIMDVVLYDITTGSFVQVDRSNVYIVQAGDLGNAIRLELPAQPMLTAGTTYFAAVHGWGGTTFEFFYGTSGQSPDNSGSVGATSLIFYPSMTAPNTGENFFTTSTPMVRLNFEMAGSVGESNDLVDFNVYPNPSTGEFNINLDATVSENVSLSVKNIVGQTIINKTIAVSGKTVETVSLSNYSKGVYFLTIDNKTVKLIVE